MKMEDYMLNLLILLYLAFMINSLYNSGDKEKYNVPIGIGIGMVLLFIIGSLFI